MLDLLFQRMQNWYEFGYVKCLQESAELMRFSKCGVRLLLIDRGSFARCRLGSERYGSASRLRLTRLQHHGHSTIPDKFYFHTRSTQQSHGSVAMLFTHAIMFWYDVTFVTHTSDECINNHGREHAEASFIPAKFMSQYHHTSIRDAEASFQKGWRFSIACS